MKTLLFDPFSGASGEMILGSLIDLGADIEKIRRAVEPLAGATLSVEKTSRGGITATSVTARPLHEQHPRRYHKLPEIIRGAELPDTIEKDALAVFGIMANAEAKVQGQSLEDLHLHEAGQDDALICVIGSCVALHCLNAEAVLTRPVNIGGGIVPATLEILKTGGLSFYGHGNRELLTPTGAAFLSHFAKPVDDIPYGRALATGYGAGADAETPDLLRTLLMDLRGDISGDPVEVLETSVDSVSGEILGNLFDRLMALGARDVTISPITMKKGRPGHIIRVVSLPHTSETLAREIMRETGTLGVRVMAARHRFIAERRLESVNVSIGGERFEALVKIASDQAGEIIDISAEYDACRKIAGASGIPLREVMRRAGEEAWKRFEKPSS